MPDPKNVPDVVPVEPNTPPTLDLSSLTESFKRTVSGRELIERCLRSGGGGGHDDHH